MTIPYDEQPAFVEIDTRPLNYAPTPRRKSTKPLNSIRRKLNGQISHVVAAIIFLSPFLYGSNRPFFWLIWSLIMGLAGTMWFLRMANSGESLRIPFGRTLPVFIPFLALSLYMILQIIPLGALVPSFSSITSPFTTIDSETLSLTPQDTLLALIRWLTYGLMFFLTLQFCSNAARARQFLSIVFWAIVVHAIVGLAMRYQFGDTIFGINKISHKGSTTGGFVNRNSFATFLSFGGVLGVVYVLKRWSEETGSDRRRPLFDSVFSKDGFLPITTGWIVILVALISTNSRMGVFAGCCAMFIIVGMAILKMPMVNRASGLLIGIFTLPAIISLSVILYGEAFLERIGQLDTTDDIETRFSLYRQTLEMIKSRYLLGYGGQSYEYAFPLFHDRSFAVHLLWDKAHSTYLTLWAEYGIVFGSLPMVLICFILLFMIRAFWRSKNADPLILAGIGTIIVAGLHSLADFSLEIEAVTFAFTAIVATSYSRALETRTSDRTR